MNKHIEIKELLNRYYEGESTDADEQRLRAYFTSDEVAAELQPYRSIFAYLQSGRSVPLQSPCPVLNINTEFASGQKSKTKNRKSKIVKWWYAAAAAIAILLTATFLVREFHPKPQVLCEGTYVVINGICYDDLSLVRKYATETIDMVTKPFGDGSAADALDFLE